MPDLNESYAKYRLNFEQQGKRAKELLKAARAGEPEALARRWWVALAQSCYCTAGSVDGDHIGNVRLFPNSTIVMQRAEYSWIHSPNGPNDNVNKLMALARKLLGTPENLQLIDGDSDVFGDGSVTLVSTPGHTPGHQSLLVHLGKSGFIILSGDVAHSEENFEKNIVPSLNTNKEESIASMEKVRQLMAAYKATLFINHDKSQSDKLELLPAFYD